MTRLVSKSICRGCRRPVLWIQTVNKKMMICDPDLKISDGTNLKLVLIAENGATLKNPAAGVSGYETHWASCQKAAEFKIKEKQMKKN